MVTLEGVTYQNVQLFMKSKSNKVPHLSILCISSEKPHYTGILSNLNVAFSYCTNTQFRQNTHIQRWLWTSIGLRRFQQGYEGGQKVLSLAIFRCTFGQKMLRAC